MTKAFTLAEVLITLAIIGVVAAMTIPTLIQSHQEKVTVTKLKKVYSVLSQAHLLAQEENGEVSTWCDGLTDNASCQTKAHDIILRYLKISKDCKSAGGCMSKDDVKNSNGTPLYISSYGNAVSSWSTFILADGTSVLLQYVTQDARAGIFVDINGIKPPNQYGRDLFHFFMYDEKFLPAGTPGSSGNNELKNYCSTKVVGNSCAAWVIYNENMDYLHCDDLAWNDKTTCK